MLNRVDSGLQMRDAVADIAAKPDASDDGFRFVSQSGFPFNRAMRMFALRFLTSGLPTSDNRIGHLCNACHRVNFVDPHDVGAQCDGERGRGRIAFDAVVRFRVEDCADEGFA